MFKKCNIFLAQFLLIGFLVGVAVGCIFATYNNMIISQNMAGDSVANCCDLSLMAVDSSHIIPSILATGVFAVIVLLAIAIVSRFFYGEDALRDSTREFYYKNIRGKYGGFHLFNYLNLLFSRGILHPKIY